MPLVVIIELHLHSGDELHLGLLCRISDSSPICTTRSLDGLKHHTGCFIRPVYTPPVDTGLSAKLCLYHLDKLRVTAPLIQMAVGLDASRTFHRAACSVVGNLLRCDVIPACQWDLHPEFKHLFDESLDLCRSHHSET